ncbi:MAG: hypothetical protein KAZ26_06340 [Caldilineaceae bacterium]|nr:hypothetical protein [Caldilineaceae bacterium]
MNQSTRQPGLNQSSFWGTLLGGLMVLLVLSVGALLPGDAPASTPANPSTGPVIVAQPISPLAIAPAQPSRPAPLFTWNPHAKRRPAPPPATEILLDLPTLTLTADPTGNLTLAGLALGSVGNVASLGLTPQLIASLSAANLQHIQLATDATGLSVEANNLPILGLAWDETSLGNSAQLLADTQGWPQIYVKAAPLLTRLHVDLVADVGQLTRTAQQPPIPVDKTITQADAAILAASAGRDTATVNLPIFYFSSGNPLVLGLGADKWEELTGMPASQLRLTPEQVQAIKSAGIRHIRLATEPDGVHLTVNDAPLPTLLWGQGEAHNLTALATALTGTHPDQAAETLTALDKLVRAMQSVSVGLDLRFP